jgi:Conjugal transfer protein TraD
MRRPRDIDAELKALQEKAAALRARKVAQLGELVIATGADALDVETLAGALLEAVETAKDEGGSVDRKEAWRRRGDGFFRDGGRGRSARRDADGSGARRAASKDARSGGEAAGGADGDAEGDATLFGRGSPR